MSIFGNIAEMAARLFGHSAAVPDAEMNRNVQSAAAYREKDCVNLTAVFAGKLAALAVTDSAIDVIGDTARAALFRDAFAEVWRRSRRWASMTLGVGGAALVPYVSGGRIFTDIVSQERIVINRLRGGEPLAVSILADTLYSNKEMYCRWTDYELDDAGLLTIRNRASSVTGARASLTAFPSWSDIPEEIAIRGVEHLPLAFLRCPIDSRGHESAYGVPITYGCKELMDEISETLEQVRKEYDLKRPMVGIDKTLFERGTDGRARLPRTGLFTPMNPAGLGEGGKLWEVYDPAIRDSAYYNRLEQLYALLERQVGTSRGILTQPESRGATATEIKAALYDTYSLLTLFRQEIERGMDALLYAFGVLANAWDLAPFGECELSFDWSYSMIESSQESFQQLITAQQSGAVEPAEIRQYIMPDETLDEARERVAEIAEQRKNSAGLLLDQAMIEEEKLNGI